MLKLDLYIKGYAQKTMETKDNTELSEADMKDTIIWIGPRKSDIMDEPLFFKSITRFGIDDKTHYSYSAAHSYKSYHDYLSDMTSQILNDYPECHFMFSASADAYSLGETIYSKSLCVNPLSVLSTVNNKIFMRSFLYGICDDLPSISVDYQAASDFDLLYNIFNKSYEMFVVQPAYGGGGLETMLVSPNSISILKNAGQVLVTPYISLATPVNVHAIIGEENTLIFPPSIQIIIDRFHFSGSDYIKYKDVIDRKVNNRLYDCCVKIAAKIKSLGYRGILGLDFLIKSGQIFFIECNGRFQGSTLILNRALIDAGLSSIYQLQYASFYESIDYRSETIFRMNIDYSAFRRTMNNTKYILPPPMFCTKVIDGDIPLTCSSDQYLYYEIFQSSILEMVEKSEG